MQGRWPQSRMRAAVGLVAAYALALQTLLAAFAPLPVNAEGVDFGQLSVICFGGGAGTSPGEPAAPPSGKLHCIVCCVSSGAATLPSAVPLPVPAIATAASRAALQDRAVRLAFARSGPARAPPTLV